MYLRSPTIELAEDGADPIKDLDRLTTVQLESTRPRAGAQRAGD